MLRRVPIQARAGEEEGGSEAMTTKVTIIVEDQNLGSKSTVSVEGDAGLDDMYSAFVAAVVAAGYAAETAARIRLALDSSEA
jgi:hypothetical protein